MQKNNSVWGVGPKIVTSTLVYLALTLYIDEIFHCFAIVSEKIFMLYFLSGILITIGLVIWVIAARTIFMMYKLDSLYKGGLYSFCRHPLYANFILILVPGLCLLTNSWIVFTTPFFMYLAFKYFIKEEEQCLIKQFGKTYIEYKEKVNSIVPKFH
ncbi:protein-S-isoprenylcysteine O-methyltransferase Ste14 [Sporomusaceae bacterium BoRhaA]|uniref:methyltransferase family protein n=1 Tax=Pelorhabdus rhamnosifermentans TaxID=2772457 RepID=UPI001C063D07|nr:isoprenylcysteine carboxylmethyltransferase family protein [Pelorhabdus rhamnosifermentans]MBU2700140.1 protein-S-isoprenylcysteine O-methyltransferase Ste14 [Pelorhabdus rhamnosifermentans]